MKIATRPITTIVLLLFLMLPLGVAAAPFVYYDVNGDGEVNIADVNALVDRIIKGGGPGDDIPQPQESTGFLSAADYGAVGDGVTDDTPALEALFADGFEKKLPIYIPEGTYMIDSPITLPLRTTTKPNLAIRGASQRQTILTPNNPISNIFSFTREDEEGEIHLELRDLGFKATGNTTNGLYFYGRMSAWFLYST